MLEKKSVVKVKRLEWTLDETFPKGEKWHGSIDGKHLTTVTRLTPPSKGDTFYSLLLGSLSSDYVECASVEAGKRAAQAALTKAVKSLLA
ncbi:hypothetical protein [Streptomyces sp. UNOC14_S4]|uniref:hypothetical protein n=1 Tax=Streptomyces sp. UNOC14_S4 TaxID=2872340 RepID=UPI001E4059D5|nr:hypothetical protein [Streptomyces sp. UNOC14_S4]MCC3766493.1 hypothetical protein [Streptomyces sp. UNOC14_S4]